MPTNAERIAAYFNNDGQCWEVAGERVGEVEHISEVCANTSFSRMSAQGADSDAERWTFADGSVLTITDGGWDLGYPACYCWRGAGHREQCEMLPDED